MNPLITKSLVGLGGLSIVGGGGLLAWNQGLFARKPETIRDKLKKEGYEVLEKTSSHWTQIFDVYKKNENTKKFKDDEITSGSTNTDHGKLKEKCEASLDLESSKKEDYEKVIKWCVVPRKAEEMLIGITLLEVDENNVNDISNWKPILDAYKKTKSDNVYELTGVTLLEPIDGDSKDAENVKELKKGCKERREKLTYDLEFEKSLEEVKKWCVSK